MKLRTEVQIPISPFSISHQHKIISFGSCFSESIGEKLHTHKFDIFNNPFGILFNPISVCSAISECLENKTYQEDELNQHNELYFSFNHHSKYAGNNKAEVVSRMNSAIRIGQDYLASSKVLIMTFGTAWVHRIKETNEVAANCYKLPASHFKKELLSVQEIVAEVSSTLSKLKKANASIQIIATISPVRHWKDGVVENQQSKGTLHLALKELNEQFENLVYFPSYEILLDELRDYRFYSSDMLHPSELAIDYIWEKFVDTFFNKETKALNKRISQLKKEKNHKPFNPESDEFIQFSQKLTEKENQMYKDFPYLMRD